MHAPVQQKLTPEIVVKLARLRLAMAREDFYQYRLLTSPGMIDCWWQRHSARAIMRWWRDLRKGKRPMLVLGAPPQHGKSEQIRDVISWVAGQNPSLKIIFTSYSNELGVSTNLAVQRKMTSACYRQIFPATRMAELNYRPMADEVRIRRTGGVIEFVGRRGSFRNTTVQGQINGQGLDVGIIDDPIKGRAEAFSETTRTMTWNWLTDDFFTRFSQSAGMILISTRWHVDDPVGRWHERFPETRILNYQAVATEDDWSVREGYRKAGEALFPEHKPIDFLMERRKLMTNSSWQSEYQQSPIVAGGSEFPIEKIKRVPAFDRKDIDRSCRYWDKAGTEGGGAYTAGVLMHRMKDKTYLIEDIRHGQWAALEREQHIEQMTRTDASQYRIRYEIWVEQEPGSGGKESAEMTVRRLAGHRVYADRVTGSKELRAMPFAAQVQSGNVGIVEGEWNMGYLDELEQFPNGRRKDRVDASSGAFNKLALPASTYNISGMA
jgi:predicted phage terminase large subunit-like protein